jgi:hypothetical protein
VQIIQFICPDEAISGHLCRSTVKQINSWSKLSLLSAQEGYETQPFNVEAVWRQHATRPELWFADWGAIYPHLGNDGRTIADFFVGSTESPGLLFKVPLHEGIMLEFIYVPDLVAAGYLLAPETEQVV